MKNLNEASLAIATVSARKRYGDYMSGTMFPRGLDLGVAALSLSMVYEVSQASVKEDLVKREKVLYEELKTAKRT